MPASGPSDCISWKELGLWPHQQKAVAAIVEYLKSRSAAGSPRRGPQRKKTERKKTDNYSALVHMPTGTGKTGAIATVSRCLPEVGSVLILTPWKALRKQMLEDVEIKFWRAMGLKNRFSRAEALLGKPVLEVLPSNIRGHLRKLRGADAVFVSTIQALGEIERRWPKTTLRTLGKRLSLLIVDEGQYEPATDWGRTVRGLGVPTVLFTATPYRNDLKTFNVHRDHIFSFTFPEAVRQRYVRNVAFHEYLPPTWDERCAAGGAGQRPAAAEVELHGEVAGIHPKHGTLSVRHPATFQLGRRKLARGRLETTKFRLAPPITGSGLAVGDQVLMLATPGRGRGLATLTAWKKQRTPEEEFVHGLLRFYDDEFPALRPRAAKRPKVLIRCDSMNSLNRIAQALHQRGRQVIAVHQQFPDLDEDELSGPDAHGGPPSYWLRKVPNPRRRRETFWVHQNKLTEGVDDPSFCLLAVYGEFKSARPLIQQVGRVIRNPGRREEGARAWVFVAADSDLMEFWENFVQFERQVRDHQTHLIDLEETSLEKLIFDMQPPLNYVKGKFRSKLEPREIASPETEIDFRLSTNVYRISDAFDLGKLDSSVCKLLPDRERKVLAKRQIPGSEHASHIYLYLEVHPSPILRTKIFWESRLGYTFFRRVDDYLFFADSHGLVPPYLSRNATPVSATDLQRLFPDSAESRLTEISMLNSDVGRHAIRGRSIRAVDIQGTAPTIRDQFYILSGATGVAATDAAPVRRYIGFSRGRVSDTNVTRVGYWKFIAWIDSLEEELRSHRHQPLPIFHRFADVAEAPLNTEPASILLDVADARERFHRSDRPQELLQMDEICAPVRDGAFTVEANGKTYRVAVKYDEDSDRYHLDCEKLALAFTSDSSLDRSLVSYLNRTQSFRVVPADCITFALPKRSLAAFVKVARGKNGRETPLRISPRQCTNRGRKSSLARYHFLVSGDKFTLRANGRPYRVAIRYDRRGRCRLVAPGLAAAYRSATLKSDLVAYLNRYLVRGPRESGRRGGGEFIELDRGRLEAEIETVPRQPGEAPRALSLGADRLALQGNRMLLKANGKSYGVRLKDLHRPRKRLTFSCRNLAARFRHRETGKDLVRFLNQEACFQLFHTSEFIYAHGQWYRPRVALTGAKERRLDFLQLFHGVDELARATSEKGLVCRGDDGWEKGSVFDLIDPRYATPDELKKRGLGGANLVVCDDMGTEVADFIAADTEGRRVMFIHAKAFKDKKERSAAGFHDVCAQAVKNLDFVNPYSNSQPPNLGRWNEPWKATRQGGVIGPVANRVRRNTVLPHGARPEELWQEIQRVERDPDSERSIWIVLGKGFSKKKFEARIESRALAPEDLQVLYLIQSTWSSVSQMGARLDIFCSP